MKPYFIVFIPLLLSLFSCQEQTKQNDAVQTEKNIPSKKTDTSLSTYVLIVNLKDKSIDRAAFAKAMAYSINRDKIVEHLYSYESDSSRRGAGVYGIVPFNTSIKGYHRDLDSAKFYLQKSGYTTDKHKIKITTALLWGVRSYTPDEQMRLDWHDIGISPVELHVEQFPVFIKDLMSGKEGIYFCPIIAPSYEKPEVFLENFYSKKGIYLNPEFDKYYEAAVQAKDSAEALKNFKAAEQILVSDAFVIPIWYGKLLK